MEWERPPTPDQLKYALKNIYMLAKRKRTVTHRYHKDEAGKEVATPVGPKSDDPDWDHIIRFCEDTGLRMSVIRLAGTAAVK